MGSGKIRIAKDILFNLLLGRHCELFYTTESADWVIKQVGKQIIEHLNNERLITSKITTTHYGIRNQIIHFGSVNTLIDQRKIKKVHHSNRLVLTWFHISPDDKRIKFIPELNTKVDIVHTASNITKEKLVHYGLDKEKIVVIPLGVDLSLFKPVSEVRKQKIRKRLDIPQDKIVVGSFQKDGVGWGEGLEPKMVKGPDIFCDVIEKLTKVFDLHVLLTGPARGYVKKRLTKSGVSYSHKYLKNYLDIVPYYQTLDLYLITSRVEGGPKGLLEAWATGVPVVSTRVGMVPDISKDRENAMLTEIENVDELTNKASQVIENSNLRQRLVKNALKSVQKHDWGKVAKKYYVNIYRKLC